MGAEIGNLPVRMQPDLGGRVLGARQAAEGESDKIVKHQNLDVALAALPYEALVIERSSYFVYPPDISLRTCSSEDLIVLKAFAGRGQDWVDVERIIVRQTGKLDWTYIREQLQPLAELKETPEILDQLEGRRVEFER